MGNSQLARTTSFKKGTAKPAKSGRMKGTRNKTTLVLREAALFAAEASGEDGRGKNGLVGFLTSLAQHEPAVFGRLLEKILPMEAAATERRQAGLPWRKPQRG
ncbi:hypothetical protein [Bradyrhizobium sp. 76]|uniref:hypothetical protein n=1 Tax=Bradyrhizobium sp. 76 TaxID=2782680 RepID=UPI001FFB3DB6|nr:hypothetical protein [Bradyrhizobium sp. 76]MCK1409539.1 hypothetical protein [Bradyrhizobium sp. 76]